jgi:hypothetical protein
MNSFNKPTNIDGWNDPPANLALSDNISTKRVLLNKRVPYTNQDLSSTNTRRNKKKTPIQLLFTFDFSFEYFNSTSTLLIIIISSSNSYLDSFGERVFIEK